MNNYKVYDIVFDEANDYGLLGISFVDMPAIEQNFVYFSKETEPKLFLNAEKHELVSPVLVPNQLIMRISPEGERYYVRCSKETIEKIAKHYIAQHRINNYSYMHEWFDRDDDVEYEDTLLKDVYTLEMWTIEDVKNDKANKVYGYHLPEGTLMVHLKIHNRKLWAKIKSGEVKGLSIEGFFRNVESDRVSYGKNKNIKQSNKMNKSKLQNLFNDFLLWYSQVSEEAKELADVASTDETESGEVSLKYYTSDTDYIEIASDGTATASDGSEVQDGEYALNDGNILVIEDGKFKETKTVEESDEPEPVEAPIAEASAGDEADDDKKDEKTEEPAEQPAEEEPKDDEEKETQEVEAPYTLVEIDINGETYNVPQPVFDYIKTLEEQAVAGENFRKELVKLQSVTPSTKPVGNVVKEPEKNENSAIFTNASSLIEKLNKRLK